VSTQFEANKKISLLPWYERNALEAGLQPRTAIIGFIDA